MPYLLTVLMLCLAGRVAALEPPVSADPYPLSAAGWGFELGNGRFLSRWAEDWAPARATGKAPPFKAAPLVGGASLTLSAEVRVRYNDYRNELLVRGATYRQSWLRTILGADLRLLPGLRVYSEAGAGQVDHGRPAAVPSLQNKASLQQLFVDLSRHIGPAWVGVMAGRQEFSDGPRQLISVSDGPNLHLAWNGARAYAHWSRFRLGAFDLRGTRLRDDAFDESVRHDEKLQGANVGVILLPGPREPRAMLDGFWFATENPVFRSGGKVGLDDRDSVAARLRLRGERARFESTLIGQTGRYRGRPIRAWGAFAQYGLRLQDDGWKPRVGARLDVASGGGSYGTGTLKAFNQLYAGAVYLGQARFFSTSNLVMVTPGLSASPTAKTGVLAEYSFARRFTEKDAAYAGGMRAYPGTQAVRGRAIGGQLRLEGSWSPSVLLTLTTGYERLFPGAVLRRAGLPAGDYVYADATFRY